MATYNGHKNYNYWNVSLWINNDRGIYFRARDLVRQVGRRAAAKALIEELPEKTPDGSPYTQSSVYAALEGIL